MFGIKTISMTPECFVAYFWYSLSELESPSLADWSCSLKPLSPVSSKKLARERLQEATWPPLLQVTLPLEKPRQMVDFVSFL